MDDNHGPFRPAVTQVRVAITRIPEEHRPRLTRLARRGAEVCRKHGAKLLAEISLALEIALMDLAGAELRAANAEFRARRAERDLASAIQRIAQLKIRSKVKEFDDGQTTATRSDPDLIAKCRQR